VTQREDGMKNATVISILALNNLDLTRQCIDSILDNTDGDYRICVFNQGSDDGTKEYLDGLGDRVDAIHSPRNIGFVTGNNRVMERYPDSDVVLLNNDTIVKKGWLAALKGCAYSDPGIGIVGAKLVYPDGLLQEAGGEIFSDGSGRNIGKFDDPGRHVYNVRREVDYCSGACLYLKRDTLNRIGYLDEAFSPAYWEDTDICFRARAAGLRVMYEPTAEVIHLEGATAGSPGKRTLSAQLQARNKPVFMGRWGKVLEKHRSNVFEVRSQTGKDKILIIQPFLPMYDRAAGEKRWFHTLKILTRYYDVVYLARNGAGQLKYVNELEKMGITVFHTDQSRLKHMDCDLKGPVWIDFPLLLKSNDFKAVIVGFYHVAHQYWRDIRRYSPESVFIIDSFDLCYVRQRRKALLSGDPADFWKAEETRRMELAMYRRADMVLTVTEKDRSTLLEAAPDLNVGISTDIHPVTGEDADAGRSDLVFVGNFNHDPNEDAVVFFMEEIWPEVKRRLPGVKFYIVGNAPTEKVQAYASEDILVTGFVPDVLPYLLKAMAFVVPLRYGAGLKGKIGEALSCGVPIVTTTVGAEGMDLVHRRSALIADDPAEFAGLVAEVCSDAGLRETLSREGRVLAERNYSYSAVEKYWKEVFEFIEAGVPRKRRPREGTGEAGYTWRRSLTEIYPDVGIVMPVHNQLEATRNCWSSIRKNTGQPYQLVLVDNGSSEDVAYEADQNNIEVIRNESNTGFANACNQGITAMCGEYVVILNNDTIVTPGWLKRLLWHMENDPTVGIVGPSTSFASTVQQIPVSYKTERDLYEFSESVYEKNRHAAMDVDKVVGVCMLMRRKVLEEIGLFDTRFGIGNFEDDDICLRARLAGYRVVWARDVFVHHEGSKTFRSLDVDYGRLMEENREKFAAKWAGVAAYGGAPACGGGAEEVPAPGAGPEDAGPGGAGAVWDRPVIVLGSQGGEALPETLQSLRESGATRIHTAESMTASGTTPVADAVMEFAARCPDDVIFFVTEGTVVTPEWVQPLEALLDVEDIGCAVPACNSGWGPQQVTGPYSRTGKPLARFARKNSLEHRGRVETLDMAFPAAMAVRRHDLLTTGLEAGFSSAALLIDLERRMKDAGKRVVCPRDSYVHYEGEFGPAAAAETGAAVKVMAANGAARSGDVTSALRDLDTAIELKPDYAEALYQRGVLNALVGRVKEARSDFERVTGVDPNDSRAYNNLGCIHFQTGEGEAAENAFTRAMEADPANWEARKNLADLYLASGRGQRGMEMYLDLLQRHNDRPEVHISVAEVFASQGDTATAVTLLKSAARLAPADRGILDALAALEKAAGGQEEVKSNESR
jgi:GT2 family glycosyltransferase/glycosyltransferase involved in cell wall biosynthesis/Flp pilus assembly protein TadD